MLPQPQPKKDWTLWILIASLFLLALNTAIASNPVPWKQWVQQLRQEAVGQGIRANLFDQIFSEMAAPQAKILHFDRTQPEKRISFIKYRSTRIDPFRIRLGQKEYQKNKTLLDQIGQDFHVDPCAVTAIWGIETSYGRYMGEFSVVKALATLAYDNRRADYFRSELLIALHILNDGHVSLEKFKGEWAGASGHPQFMPSSWQKYAVDYDHDGRRDIWGSFSDAFASVANYLAINGWQEGQPYAIQVQLPSGFSDNETGLNQSKLVSQWLAEGVKPSSEVASQFQSLKASIIRPSGGPDFMVFNNFKVFMKYNNSIFYAASVGYLSDKICGRAG